LTDDEWSLFKQFEVLLKPFNDATEDCCADKRATLQDVVPWSNELLDHCEQILEQEEPADATLDTSTLYDAAEEARDKLLKYYDISSEHMTIAVLLDPRQKLSFYTHEITDDNVLQDTKTKFEKQLREVYDQYKTDRVADTEPVEEVSSNHPRFKRRKLDKLSDEVQTYLYDTATPKWDDDPAAWWRANNQRFPVLAKMARDYLAIPGTSASSERAFSKAGLLITDRRTRLGAASIKACILLQSWLTENIVS